MQQVGYRIYDRSQRRERVIVHARFVDGQKEEYFFSTDHCQQLESIEGINADEWVPTTFYLPQSVVPRPELPSGIVATVEDVKTIFFYDAKEIPNPDPRFQPLR